jgi:hypothetical protein
VPLSLVPTSSDWHGSYTGSHVNTSVAFEAIPKRVVRELPEYFSSLMKYQCPIPIFFVGYLTSTSNGRRTYLSCFCA